MRSDECTASDCDEAAASRRLHRLLGRRNVLFAWAVLIVALIHPPHGTGLPICWFHASTHVPCPGCGLTRSVSCAARGMWQESWSYHPFGTTLLAIFGVIAITGVLPTRWHRQVTRQLVRRPRTLTIVYGSFIAMFVLYGAFRALSSWLR